ncbi:thiol:disulfide interchange protein DsbA/DsbL [Alcaligenes endophyticus]|uniref:Thiol:disulfide interchange protein n=1 Tax=Alcaligenes endophyticus TaxID=1929088 RepID=A0ABT8EF70_9BURK|nr:thiol:disulfide interchange protein DsbA/DsbL [Alcaligenes endophyticus]MCX5590437.1 thiol:disulfide interchange protein DsbA/DsbL [Alcaligenes endophyticus]MDN4119899.1 thiol:disulfide interchange protein DsbA/DsbL [Alcaligenes endophyticus]
MTLKSLLTSIFSIAALSAATLLPATSAQAQDGYTTLSQVLPSDTSGKTEVLEFFSYGCSHCAVLEPKVAAWAKTLPDDVVLHPVPVGFNAGMTDMQKLYYTLVALDRTDLHPEVFKAIHQEKKPLFDLKNMSAWAEKQGLDKTRFEQTFNSFGVATRVNKANQLTQAYMIQGTPSLAIGGQYVTSPSMAKGYDQTITQAQALLKKLGK